MVISRDDYKNKLLAHVENEDVYEKLRSNANPLKKVAENIRKSLKPMIEKGILSNKMKMILNPSADRCELPRPYGLIKLHKPEAPARMIIPSQSSPTHVISHHLDILLKPAVENLKFRCKSASDLIEKLNDLKIPSTAFLASLDVVALYDNVDIHLFLGILPKILKDTQEQWSKSNSMFRNSDITDILEVFQVVLLSAYFEFEGNKYRQKRGLPMGSPVSVAVAELFMDFVERNRLRYCPSNYKPVFYTRYLDDIFVIMDGPIENLNKFQDHLNRFDKSGNLKFTMEIESQATISFLDVQLHRSSESITTSVYRKPTHCPRFLNPNSTTPKSFLRAVLLCMKYRAQKYSSTEEKYKEEIDWLRKAFINNGYETKMVHQILLSRSQFGPKNRRSQQPTMVLPYIPSISPKLRYYLESQNFRVCFTKCRTLGQLIYKKFHPKKPTKNAVYQLKCNDCNSIYIGKTSRTLDIRIKEHQAALADNNQERQMEKSAMAHHCRVNKHSFSLDKILARDSNHMRLLCKESLYIKASSSTVNGNTCSTQISPSWSVIYNTL